MITVTSPTRRRLSAGLAAAALAALTATTLLAQIDVGKVGKYHELSLDTPNFKADAYPEVSLEDLRKITMFSKLAIRGSRVSVADDEYMRAVAPHPTDKDILVVTSDHFRFTVFKNAQAPAAGLVAHERAQFAFLWIKHATKEESPDGTPWLKDLVLLPLKGKKGELELAAPWPLSSKVEFNREKTPYPAPLFVTQLDPRPDSGDFPKPEKCVVGVFASGSSHYLVLDFFGGWAWWGRIGAEEFVSLRGKAAAAIDLFHGGPIDARRRAPPKWLEVQWANPQLRQVRHSILAEDRVKGNAIIADVPKLFAAPVRRERTAGFEDLLRLDFENRPVKAIDDEVNDFKTFGELVAWGTQYLAKYNGADSFRSWFGPLEDHLKDGEPGHIQAARAVRYAFRRLGFPATIRAFDSWNKPWYPHRHVQVYVPSVDMVYMFDQDDATVFRPSSVATWSLPHTTVSRRGTIPLWDVQAGGGSYYVHIDRK